LTTTSITCGQWSRFLNRHGYDVATFDTAEGALEAISQLKPDLALIDVMMPGMGGLDLAQKIRETTRGHTPVVFLTGLDSEEVYYEGHVRGGAFMIGKSEKPQKVLDVVDYFAGNLGRVGAGADQEPALTAGHPGSRLSANFFQSRSNSPRKAVSRRGHC